MYNTVVLDSPCTLVLKSSYTFTISNMRADLPRSEEWRSSSRQARATAHAVRPGVGVVAALANVVPWFVRAATEVVVWLLGDKGAAGRADHCAVQ